MSLQSKAGTSGDDPASDGRVLLSPSADAALFGAAVYGVTAALGGDVVLVPGALSVTVAVGTVIPVVFVLGAPGAVGVMGASLAVTLLGGLDGSLLATTATLLLLSGVTLAVRKPVAGDPSRTVHDRSGVAVGPFVSTAVIAAAAASGFVAWVTFLRVGTPFAVTATGSFLEQVVTTFAATPFVVVVLGGVFGRSQLTPLVGSQSVRPIRLRTAVDTHLAATAFAWPVLGTLFGLGFDVGGRLLPTVRPHLPFALSPNALDTVASVGQTTLGGVVCCLLGLLLVRRIRRRWGTATVSDTDGPGPREPVRFTRRDALAAAAVGGGGAAVALATEFNDDAPSAASTARLTDASVTTAHAVATVVSPSAVDVTEQFVGTYLAGLSPDRTDGVVRAVDALDERARAQYGVAFARLSAVERETLLRELGVDRVASDADGTVAERVRYSLVNELLYALLTAPTGSRLFGVDNPVGHPGGFEGYQREPKA